MRPPVVRIRRWSARAGLCLGPPLTGLLGPAWQRDEAGAALSLTGARSMRSASVRAGMAMPRSSDYAEE
ncbi:hypothetical protein SCATT_14390 [Streptantibioticus cattleyicolor NRRL 8057 = DSM 46488]|uniref:Uncharacterized protein n=1 Tax=Streptantibioticus cattleyicolor (strain ATCC 35852 / DSM 46488 / JCM 4925 / NBRC 14057 / NRRL 8057) TaxID=1003195 RepID=G8WZ61_STREN|nr:hypothetical protein SCATT_14390 [Streptantibioticus cattleyicolor NRRL 8057 = DSM 46488]